MKISLLKDKFNSLDTAKWTVNAAQKGTFAGKFFFVNCGTGSKDFYALWHSVTGVTATMAQWGTQYMTVTELFM